MIDLEVRRFFCGNPQCGLRTFAEQVPAVTQRHQRRTTLRRSLLEAVALGIDIDGVKHPLAIEEGSTENATLVTDLITGLRERGLDVTRPILAVLDGAKVLSRAVRDVFDQPLIQRCQQHKIKNGRYKLPERLRTVTERRMRQAYHACSAVGAEGLLEQLARELGKTHPAPPRRCGRAWPRR